MSKYKMEFWKSSQWQRLAWMGVLATLFLWGSMSKVEARPYILHPGSRPGMFQASVGVDLGVAGTIGAAGYLSNVVGYHFGGRSSGPALGGVFDIGFSSVHVQMVLGARFWWDIPIAGMAVYIAPFVQPGFAITDIPSGFGGSQVGVGFDLQFGVEGRVILNDRLILSLRPISFELLVGGGVVFAIHVMHLGVGVTF